MKVNKYQLYLGIFYIILTVIFYFLNYFTPMYSDDWVYQYHSGNNLPINTFPDVISSQIFHYLNINGRVLPHFVLQIFDGLLGKSYYNVINAILFSVFIYLLNVITIGKQHDIYRHFCSSFVAITLICLLFPGFKMCFIWMTGSCNYLFTAVLLLLYHYILLNNTKIEAKFYPFLFIGGLCCGLTHEGLTLGLAVGYLIFFYLNKNFVTVGRLVQLIGFLLGVGLLVFAPGSFHRAVSTSDVTQLSIIGAIKSYVIAFASFQNLRILFLLLISLIILHCFDKLKFKFLIRKNIPFVIALIITFLFVWMTKFDSLRSRFGIEFYSLIILLQLIGTLNVHKTLTIIAGVVCIFILPMGLYYSYCNYKNVQNYISQIKKHDNNIIMFFMNRESSSFLHNRFVFRFALPDDLKYYWNFSKKSLENSLISRQYGKEYIRFLPFEFINDVKQKKQTFNEFNYDTTYPFYVKEIGNDVSIKNVVLHYTRNYTSLYDKIKYAKIPESVLTDRYDTVRFDKRTFLLVKRDFLSDKFLTQIDVVQN